MKTLFKLCVLLLCMGQAVSANEYINGEGRFYAADDDSLAFVKNQLTANAFQDVISKELSQMGLDASLFWNKWNSRFEAYLQGTVDALKKKYGVEDESASAGKKNEYQKALRQKRLELHARYGDLSRVITSYSIKRMTRSTQVPNSRYMSLQAKVDRRLLNQIYFDFVRDGESRHFPTIYLTGKFTLEGGTWSDVGVGVEKDFTDVVLAHWKKWLSEHLSERVGAVVITDEDIENDLRENLKRPLMTSVQLAHVESEKKTQSAQALTEDTQVESAPVPSGVGNSLWLQLNFTIKKIDEDEVLSNRTFQVSGSGLLLDMKFHRPLMARDFSATSQVYSTEDLTAMSSALASYIYRLPVAELKSVPRELGRMSSGERVAEVTLEGAPHIGLAQSFIGSVVDKGLSQQLSASLKESTPYETGFYINFNGESDKLVALLRSFNNTDINNDFMVTMPDEANPFHFKVVQKFVSRPKNSQTAPAGI